MLKLEFLVSLKLGKLPLLISAEKMSAIPQRATESIQLDPNYNPIKNNLRCQSELTNQSKSLGKRVKKLSQNYGRILNLGIETTPLLTF